MRDLSGEYVLNRLACVLSRGADAIQSGRLRIEHVEPVFRCHMAVVADAKPLEYSFELRSDAQDSSAGSETASLRWEDNGLVARFRTENQDFVRTMSWRYELEDGGRRLKATERIRGGGQDQDNIWIFDRC